MFPAAGHLSGEALVRWLVAHLQAHRASTPVDAAPLARAGVLIPTLPQLLRGAGIERLVFDQLPAAPRGQKFPRVFHWQGLDGTRIIVLRRGTPVPPSTADLPIYCGTLLPPSPGASGGLGLRPQRQAEILLHDAAFLAASCPAGLPADTFGQLCRAWETLLNLSAGVPARRSGQAWAALDKSARSLLAKAATAWTRQIDTHSFRRPLVVFNTLSWTDAAVIAVHCGQPPRALRDGAGNVISPVQKVRTAAGPAFLVRPTHVPGLGYEVYELSAEAPPYNPLDAVTGQCAAGGGVLENRLLRVEIDGAGQLSRIFDKAAQRDVLAPDAPANQFVLLTPGQAAVPVTGPARLRLAEAGPLRAVVEVRRALGRRSQLCQRIVLHTESCRIDFETQIIWRERTAGLAVRHPVAILASSATGDIPWGQAAWPILPQVGGADCAVSAHSWLDLSESGYGVALLQDGGAVLEACGHVLALQLCLPQARATPGPQHGTYSLYPHVGDAPAAGVLQQAARLGHGLQGWIPGSHPGPRPPRQGLVHVDAPNVIVESFRRSDTGSAVLVRLREVWGRRGPITLTLGQGIKNCTPVDLLERPLDLYDVVAESRTIRLFLPPWSIRTLALEFI